MTMKKIFTYVMMAAVALVAMVGCNKVTTEGFTNITYYPKFELQGDEFIIHQVGTSFVDPGCKVTLDGELVEPEVSLTVDGNEAGIYDIEYSYTNADGFASSVSRRVVVCASADEYIATDQSQSGKSTYAGEYSVTVYDFGNGNFYFSDLLGGWYAQGRGYGDNYNLEGEISSSPVKHVWSYVAGWGDSASEVTGTYDASAGVFDLKINYADMPFTAKFTKK